MQQGSRGALVVSLCALVCAAAAAMSWWPPGGDVRTDDLNGDGRPDVWRGYDRHGQLATMAVDTNFDGRSDVHEYYESGGLVRRESDRDFNDRIDLVQEFDGTTREHVRAVVDIDFDGTADLLILFQRGQPVFSKWAHPVTPALARGFSAPSAGTSRRTANDQLTSLEDPFRADLAVRAVHVGGEFGDCIGLATSGGLPASCGDAVSPLASSSEVSHSRVSHLSSATGVPYSPRGPPAPHLPS